jgi:hypothetical protein
MTFLGRFGKWRENAPNGAGRASEPRAECALAV